MSWLDTLSNITSNVGRGAEDLFTLGGAELARKYGGQGVNNALNIGAKGLGANFEAGAAGGAEMLGAQGMGAFGGSTMTPYMPTSAPAMGQAGSTLGGGMGSAMNLAPAYGSQTGAVATGMPTASAATPSTAAKLLQGMRGMPSGGGSQGTSPASKQANMLQMIYQMMPGLKPGSNNMGQMNVGGF